MAMNMPLYRLTGSMPSGQHSEGTHMSGLMTFDCI